MAIGFCLSCTQYFITTQTYRPSPHPDLLKSQNILCCRLLHVRNANCIYSASEVAFEKALEFVKQLNRSGVNVNKTALYSEYSALLFAKSEYDKASIVYFIVLEFVPFQSRALLPCTKYAVLEKLGWAGHRRVVNRDSCEDHVDMGKL